MYRQETLENDAIYKNKLHSVEASLNNNQGCIRQPVRKHSSSSGAGRPLPAKNEIYLNKLRMMTLNIKSQPDSVTGLYKWVDPGHYVPPRRPALSLR